MTTTLNDNEVAKIMVDGGVRCGNCGTWRVLRKGYLIETCRGCDDDETDITMERDVP